MVIMEPEGSGLWPRENIYSYIETPAPHPRPNPPPSLATSIAASLVVVFVVFAAAAANIRHLLILILV
jgi:hypothetical protein